MTKARRSSPLEPIAVTGIGCRFPGGGHGPDAFFDLMMRRVDAISEVPADRWDWRAYYDPEQGKPGRTYARWGGFLDDIARFDAQAFGISPREAPHIDPQQRLLLEAAWEALEDAGEPVRPSTPTSTGVFVGISTNDYNIIQARTPEVDPYTTPGTVMSIAANRISYCLNLTGPSVAVDTACSSSLVAVHSACRALQNEECDVAIAAGVNCLILPYEFVAFSSMTMLSPEGRCRAFDAKGAGFVRGEGVGAIVLKPLSKALAAGDRIYALIRGTGVNQDGRTNGMTVPSAEAQEALILHVAAEAGVSPGDLHYFEAHGTGTPVGDPIEARALGGALSRDRKEDDPCLVGSVKTNIGHLEAGAGIAGIIKTALTLHHGVIPPNLHFVTPNPKIDFQKLKLKVVTEPERYGEGPRLAGVNSFGFGGTNGHAILEAAPRRERSRLHVVTKPDGSPRTELFVASARSQAALKATAKVLAKHLEGLDASGDTLPEVCRQAATRRGHHEHRVAVVATTAAEVASGLSAFARGVPRPSVTAAQTTGAPPKLVFVYGGQGPQWWAMGRQLYASEPVFRAKLDECHEAMRAAGGFSLLDELLADEARSRMADTAVGQPSIFAIQVSLAALWASWGIHPDAVVGHSVGEVAAVHAAGILDLPSAMKVIYHRGRTMSHAPGGRMLAAGISGAEAMRIAAAHSDKVFVGAINSPTAVTLSGDGEALEEVRKVLEARGAFVRFLTVPYAFHSAQMDPVKDELLASIADLQPQDAKLPIMSTVTGARAKGKDFGPDYWWKNVRQTVRFAPALERLAAEGYSCFLELAPHPVLSTSIQECYGDRSPKAVVLPSLRRNTDERATMIGSLGGLYTLGFEPRWEGLWPKGQSGEIETVALPGYAWQKERYWNEGASSLDARVKPSLHPILTNVGRGAEPSWEGRLDPKLLPWLPAHAIEGRAVFPGAGYVELAIAAGKELAGDAPVVLEEVEIEKALFVPTGDEQAYLELRVHPAESAFAIASKVGDAKGDWTRHVNGKVRALSGKTPGRVDRAKIASGLGEALDVELFYARFLETGLEFGPAFRTVKEGRRRDGEALARIEADPKLHGGRFHVHPALFDGCLQVVAAAARAGDPRLQLPVFIDRVRFYQAPPERFWAHATLLAETEHGLLADVVAFDDEGNVLFEASGFRARAVDGLTGAKKDDRLHELVWEPKALAGHAPKAGLPALDLEVIAAKLEAEARALSEELGHRARLRTLDPLLRALAGAYAAKALADVPVGGDADVRAALARLATGAPTLDDALAGLRASNGDVQDATARAAAHLLAEDRIAEAERRLVEHLPAMVPELMLFQRTGRGLVRRLRGEVGPKELLAPNGALNALEAEEGGGVLRFTGHRTASRFVAELVAAAPEGRPLRVLELGGGLGGLAARVAPELPAGRTTYLFTDASDLGFERAEQKLRDYPFVTLKKLDLAAPDHGLADASFDLVLASDVLGRAADPKALLASIGAVLAPGGVVVALEAETSGPLHTFVRGLDATGSIRDRAAWRSLFAEAGLTKPAVVADGDAASDGARVVLFARAVSEGAVSPETVTEGAAHDRGRWLLLGDQTGVAGHLRTALEARGETVATIDVASYGAAGPTREELVERLRNTASAAPLRGVVHLLALDAPANDAAPSALSTSEVHVLHTALRATQALIDAGGDASRRPKLWLVTRGAQAAGERPAPIALAQAPLVGLGRTIINEQPSLGCRMIDLGPALDAASAELAPGELEGLVAELSSSEHEEEVALRGEARWVHRLIRRDDAAKRPARVRTRLADELGGSAVRLEIPNPGALDAMVFRPRARRAPGPGEVEIAVHAAALNFRDVMKALGIYPGDAPDAAVLGDEGAGVVVRVGPGVTRFREGDHVMGVGGGYFGSHVTVPEAFVLAKPRHLSFDEASTTLVAYMTAWHALHTLGRMKKGEKALIHAGTGGVGLAAIAVVQAAGGEVFATAGSAEKRAFLRGLGVNHVFDSRSLAFADEIMAVTGGKGVDLVLNSLAGDAIEKSLGVLGPRGRFLEIGKRDIYGNTKIGLRPFRNNLSYSAIDLGATMEPGFVGPFLAELRAGFESGALPALPHRVFPIGDAVGAFRYMTQARQIGKLVLRVAGESVPLDRAPEARPLELRSDATYVVTGGNGGFGLETARWLVESGARHVVITSRSGTANEAVLAELAKKADVRVMRSDVASFDEVTKLFDVLARELPPVRGVIHSAMVLDDGVIPELDGDRFHRVMAPKAHGAWNLHHATKALALDFFVLYSSVSAVIGNPGQASYAAANAALDALAHERRRLGLPALAVNWGLLGEVGVVTRNAKLVDHFARMGMGALTTREALSALGKLLRAGATQTSVVKVDWPKWGASHAKGPGPRYTHLIGAGAAKETTKTDGRALKEALALSPDGAKEKVEGYLREQVGKVLRTPAARIAEDLVLTELGLDSLMAVELIHRLEAELSVHLPTGKLMGQPTIAKMSTVLMEALVGKKGAAPASSAPEAALLPPKAAPVIAHDAALEAEVHLALDPPASPVEEWRVTDPRAVLVTGPLEPFGAHLVSELLATTAARVHCLVEGAGSTESARTQLQERVREVVGAELDVERLVPVLGDLAKPRLGLSEPAFTALANEVDAIIHNGARFNHVASYEKLKAANVDATIEVLQLATTGPTKPVCYVSGIASLTAHVCREGAPMGEADPLPASGNLVGGYAQSRWVAEKILGLAIERGFPVSIHRPGLLLGDVGSAAINADDLSWRAVKACLDVGAVPSGDWDVYFTPVSWARRVLVALSRRTESIGHTFHLVPPERRRLTDLIRPAAEVGYTLVELPREEWETKVIARASKGTASPILPYLMFLPEEVLAAFRSVPGFPAVDSKNVQTALPDSNYQSPPIDDALVRCLRALEESGALPKQG